MASNAGACPGHHRTCGRGPGVHYDAHVSAGLAEAGDGRLSHHRQITEFSLPKALVTYVSAYQSFRHSVPSIR